MKHHELPHIQRFIDKEEQVLEVITMLEDMRDECSSNGVRNAAILARDTHKCLVLVTQVIDELKKYK